MMVIVQVNGVGCVNGFYIYSNELQDTVYPHILLIYEFYEYYSHCNEVMMNTQLLYMRGWGMHSEPIEYK